MKRKKPLTLKEEAEIVRHLLDGFGIYWIMNFMKLDVHIHVSKLFYIQRRVLDNPNKIHFGHKNQAYNTEEELLTPPSYKYEDLSPQEKELYNEL